MSRRVQKLTEFFSEYQPCNVYMALGLLFASSCWVTILVIKLVPIQGNEEQASLDNRCDFLKLFLVWTNIFMLGLLLFQNEIFAQGAYWMKVIFGAFLIGLNITALINLGILYEISQDPTNQNIYLLVPFNYDWLTFGITLFTDIAYLGFYGIFKAGRAMVMTSLLIIIEIIIYFLAVKLSSDYGYSVDIANATLALVTASMAIILWSGQVVMDEHGNPKEFRDFLIRDDLIEMEVRVSTDTTV